MKRIHLHLSTSYRVRRNLLATGFLILLFASILSHSNAWEMMQEAAASMQAYFNNMKLRQFGWIAMSILALSCYPYLLIRQRNETQRMRVKLASDLHDDLGSLLNSVHIYTELALIKGETSYLYKIKESTEEAINGIRNIIWQLDDHDNTFSNLVSRITDFASPLCQAKNINFKMEMTKEAFTYQLSEEEKRNLYLIIKEAVNNSIKYASAKLIQVVIGIEKDKPVINIKDDGKGFQSASTRHGNGIRNMKARAAWLHYDLLIQSLLGTSIQLQKK